MANRPITLQEAGRRAENVKPTERTARHHIRRTVAECKRAAGRGDYAAAHIHEKTAWQLALYNIALLRLRPEGAESLAAEALETVDIEFPRNYT